MWKTALVASFNSILHSKPLYNGISQFYLVIQQLFDNCLRFYCVKLAKIAYFEMVLLQKQLRVISVTRVNSHLKPATRANSSSRTRHMGSQWLVLGQTMVQNKNPIRARTHTQGGQVTKFWPRGEQDFLFYPGEILVLGQGVVVEQCYKNA